MRLLRLPARPRQWEVEAAGTAWVVGILCFLLASCLLVAPHQFAASNLVEIRTIVGGLGTALALAGVGVLLAAAGMVPRRPCWVPFGGAFVALLACAAVMARGDAWFTAVWFGALALGCLTIALLTGRSAHVLERVSSC